MALSFSSSTSASDSQATRRSRARFQPRRDTLERCLSYAVASKKKKADEARRPKRQGKMSMMDAEHETIEAKTHLSFPTSMSQSAQRLLSGSLSRARSIRSCLSLIHILAILL